MRTCPRKKTDEVSSFDVTPLPFLRWCGGMRSPEKGGYPMFPPHQSRLRLDSFPSRGSLWVGSSREVGGAPVSKRISYVSGRCGHRPLRMRVAGGGDAITRNRLPTVSLRGAKRRGNPFPSSRFHRRARLTPPNGRRRGRCPHRPVPLCVFRAVSPLMWLGTVLPISFFRLRISSRMPTLRPPATGG